MGSAAAHGIDLERLPSALFVLDDGVARTANAAARTLLGDVVGLRLRDLVLDHDRALLDAWLTTSASEPAEVELRVRRPDGVVRMLAFRRPTTEALGEGAEVLVGVEDRTELARLEHAIGALGCAAWGVDATTKMHWRPRMNAALTGVDDEAAREPFAIDTIHPEDLPTLLSDFQRLLEHPGEVVQSELRAIRPEASAQWFRVWGIGTNLLDDPLLESIVLLTRMDDRQEGSAALLDHQSAFLSLAALTPVGILLCDGGGDVRYSNPQAARILADADPDATTGLVDRHARNRMSDHATLQSVVRAALETEEVCSDVAHIVERRPPSPDPSPADRSLSTQEPAGQRDHAGRSAPTDRDGDGSDAGRWVRFDARAFHDPDGRAAGAVVTVADVTEDTEARAALHRAQEELWSAANHDHLTGLPNRSLFLDRLEQALARERRERHGVAVLYCDLDGFKAVNDRHGHQLGDDVLVELAARFERELRATDTACRMGGDEFVALCEGFATIDEVEATGERLVRALSRPVTTSRGGIVVGATVGVAVADGSSTTGGLLSLADRAMYAAKALGKGRVALATS